MVAKGLFLCGMIALFFPLLSTLFPLPLCSIYTPNSILAHQEDYKPLYVGLRQRYGTCTGAAWFHEYYLAVLNLLGKKIIVYKFNPVLLTFTALQEINNLQGANLCNSENLVASPDGTLLAVCSDKPSAGITLYAIDQETHRINPLPLLFVPARQLIHNVRFSHDGAYLATVGWDNKAAVCIYQVLKEDNNVRLKKVYQKAHIPSLKPKGIYFSHNNKFVIICYSTPLSATPAFTSRSKIEIYPFNYSEGSLANMICNITNEEGSESFEDLALINNDTTLVLSNQMNDSLVMYPFNPHTGQLDNHPQLIQNPQAQLSFPHGLALSPNGKYLVVTNYGDDKCNLYQIKND
jgi:6-phosphogluconolactonase (cycloisomerase 2 family)